MYEHEAESDDDCDVYFLKPVNEYNIVEKIKEANKELFALEEQDEKTPTTALADENAGNRKVTFALNLEDYEPLTTNAEPEKNAGNEDIMNELELKLKCAELLKCTTIIEEIQLEDESLCTDDVEAVSRRQTNNKAEVTAQDTKLRMDEMAALNSVSEEEEEELSLAEEGDEDISEEIIVTDMECEKERIETTQRLMPKQTTFDYDEEDNRSMTNLLPSSDCEYEPDETQNDVTATDNELADPMDSSLEEDDDGIADNDIDDDISMIVAAYMPKDVYLGKADDAETQAKGNSNAGTMSTVQTKQSNFTKSFSLRRKSKLLSSQEQSSETEASLSSVPELKLNYKTCCEYRNAMQEQLPKYTGYLSEYGLSREQLIRREEQQRRKHRFVLEQTLKSNEDDMRKMQDNERAFTRWLKNKMRYPINKTRNMFDVKLRRNTMVGACNAHECNGNSRYK